MKFSVKFKADGVRKMFKDLEKEFKEGADGAKAGYYEGEQHKGENATLSEIALFNEFGTKDIPARPFLRNAEAKIQQRAPEIVQKGLDDGKTLNKIMAEIAQDMRNQIIESITSNTPPPNKPSTIRQKGSTHTLIDTGGLRYGVHVAMVKDGREKPLGK
jgi:hypothetical protein|nr:MAG TPA: virion morphogenesis protein [Caudoviricetes sp.]